MAFIEADILSYLVGVVDILDDVNRGSVRIGSGAWRVNEIEATTLATECANQSPQF
jgi:hypothetical protein